MTVCRGHWLCHYKWKENFLSDFIAGCTMAIIQIPQGMAYALLANCQPVVGIYTSIFPVLVYSLLGPSPNASKGTNALMCMLTGSLVLQYGALLKEPPEKIVASLCLLAGAWQVFLAVIKFAKISWVLSDIFMSAFISGASLHILVSQISHLLGIKIAPVHHQKLFQLITKCQKIFDSFYQLNVITVAIGLTSFSFLISYEFFLKETLAKKLKIHFPIHIVVVASAAWISGIFDFHGTYDVDVIGHIPVGFPSLAVTQFSMPWPVIVDSLKLAVVGFCISLSMAKSLDDGHVGHVKATRELVADGCSNICGAIFQCIPSTSSMSRSFVQVQINGRTQMTGMVSALVLMLVSVTISHMFEPLPKTVLAAIILVCLKGAFKNFRDFFKFFSNSKVDGMLWLLTLVAVTLSTPDLGMAAGVALNLLIMAYRANNATIQISMGELTGGGHNIIKASGIIMFSNVERLLEEFATLARTLEPNSIVVIDFTMVHYLDQMAAKVIVSSLQNPSVDKSFIVSRNGKVRSMLIDHGVSEHPRLQLIEEIDESDLVYTKLEA